MRYKYFIAKAAKGHEFLFSKSLMIGVPTRSKELIRDALNQKGYELKEGQVWHIFENDYYYNDYINAVVSRVYNGKFRIERGFKWLRNT